MRTRLMFIISIFLISFCIVGYKFADDNDDEKIEITKIETEIEIGSELIIAVENGKNIYIVSENENIAWAYVNGNEVTIIGVSEGETIVTISVDDNIEDDISIIVTVNDPFGSGSSNVGNTTDNKDDNADTFCPLESNEEPEEIPDGFRLVYIRMSGKEVPAWTDDFYYIFFAELPYGEESWVIYDGITGGLVKYEPGMIVGRGEKDNMNLDSLIIFSGVQKCLILTMNILMGILLCP